MAAPKPLNPALFLCVIKVVITLFVAEETRATMLCFTRIPTCIGVGHTIRAKLANFPPSLSGDYLDGDAPVDDLR